MPKRGFTLIELLVVISIISLLSSVILVTLGSARIKAENSRRNSMVGQYRNALALYASSHNGLYPWPGEGAYCVGTYNNPLFPVDNPCGTLSTCTTNCASLPGKTGLESYLSPHIQGFPPISNRVITSHLDGSNPAYFLGGVYTCSNGSISGCANPAIQWLLEGTNQNCGSGIQYGPYGSDYAYGGRATYCVLFVGQ